MSSEIEIEPFGRLKECADSIGVSSFVSAANIGPKFVFVTNRFQPIFFNVDTNYLAIFQGKVKGDPSPSCIDISDDGKFVVTGHDDGSCLLWSATDNYTLLKAHKKLHQGPISHVKFGDKNDVFYASDSMGVTTRISVQSIFGMVSFKESLVYEGKMPVHDLVVSRSDGPFPVGYIVFPTSYVVFDPKLLSGGAFTEKKSPIVFKSDQFYDPPVITLKPRDQDYFMALTSGTALNMMQVRSPGKMVSLLSDFKSEKPGTVVLFLSASLLVVITNDGTMLLLTTNSQLVCSSFSNELSELISGVRTVLCHNEKVLLLTSSNLVSVAFASWDQMILKQAKAKNWDSVFRALSEVQLGLNHELVGIPTNEAVKHIKVTELGKKVITEFTESVLRDKDVDLTDAIKRNAYMVVNIGLNDILATDVYDMFKEAGHLEAFFEGFFTGTAPTQAPLFCTPEFIEKYMIYSEEKDIVKQAEERLCSLSYNEAHVPGLAKIAVSHKFLEFAKHLYITYLDNYLVPCQLFFENGRLLDFLESVYTKSSKNIHMKTVQCLLTVWLFCPNSEGQFERLLAFFSADWKKAPLFANRIVSLLPIQYGYTEALRLANVAEAILYVLNDVDYNIALPFLKLILPLVPTRDIPIGSASLHHIIRWVFTSDEPPSVRENVLDVFAKEYPNAIPDKLLGQWCESAGFVRAIAKLYVGTKQYGKIVATMILSDEGRVNIFDFLEEHAAANREEVRTAVMSHIRALLCINSLKFVGFVNKYYPSSHDEILEQLGPQLQLLYLNSYVDVVGSSELSNDWARLLFKLILDYDPRSAPHFLTEHINELDLDEAQRLCEKKGRVDCLVQIRMYNQQNREAVDEIGHEIERTLIDFIESSSTANPSNIDELADMAELKEPMDAIRVAIKLLESTKDESDNAMQWQHVYMYFQFPMYLSATKAENIKNAVTLMFSYFFVASLNTIQAYTAFLIMSIRFAGLDQSQYHEVLSHVFSRIDYQKNLFAGVEHMLINDCLDLLDKVFKKETRGIGCQSVPHCSMCQEPIMRSGVKFKIYDCGHCYHLKKECGNHTVCPICTGMGSQAMIAVEENVSKRMTTRRVQQVMRRMEYALRKNFGEVQEEGAAGASVYFAEQKTDAVLEQVDLVELTPPPTEHVIIFDF